MGDAPGRGVRRYSDRYFVGDVPSDGAPRAIEQREVTEVGFEPPEPRTRFERWRVPVAVGLAFVLGASGGAYGWERWRDHRALAAAQAEINVSTAVTSAAWFTDNFQASVKFVNEGPYDVTVTRPAFADPALETAAVEAFTVPAQGEATRVLAVTANCGAMPTPAGSEAIVSGEIEAVVTTADGADRRRTFTGSAEDADQLAPIGAACSTGDQSSFIYFSTTSVSGSGTGLRVLSNLTLGAAGPYGGPPAGPGAPVQVEIQKVQAGNDTGTYTLSTQPALPAVMSVGDVITVQWEVGSCTAALRPTDLDMTLTFTGRVPDQPGAASSYLSDVSVELAIALVRLANERCG